jgi:hypothetical protein
MNHPDGMPLGHPDGNNMKALSSGKSKNHDAPLALDALRDLSLQSKVIADILKGLVLSENRHGDLQVIRSAALRLVEAADVLIKEEQR